MSKENKTSDKQQNKKDFVDDVSERLYSMKLLEFASIGNGSIKTHVKRVPGGWLFYNYDTTQGIFVPFNNEFQNARQPTY